MLATPTYGLRYPELTDRPTGDSQLAYLAEDGEKALKALQPDSGTRQAPVTAATDWGLLVAEYRTLGKDCSLHVWVVRTGATFTATSVGNIADTVIANVTDPALRPTMPVFGWFRASLTGGGAQLLTSGAMSIADAHSNGVIRKNTDEESSTVQLYFNYPIP